MFINSRILGRGAFVEKFYFSKIPVSTYSIATDHWSSKISLIKDQTKTQRNLLSWLTADSTVAGVRTFEWVNQLSIPTMDKLVAFRTVTKYGSDKVFVQAISIASTPNSDDTYTLKCLSETEVTNNLTDWTVVATTTQVVFLMATDRQLRGLVLVGVPLIKVREDLDFNFNINGEKINVNFKSDYCGIVKVCRLD